MTKAQLANIRKELETFTFDSSKYLRLSVMTLDDAKNRKASPKRKSTSSSRAKSKKK